MPSIDTFDGITIRDDLTSELLSIATGYDGTEYASAGEAMHDLQFGLNSSESRRFTPKWEYGYINGSGEERNNQQNIRMASPVHLPLGSIVNCAAGINLTIHVYDSNGTWLQTFTPNSFAGFSYGSDYAITNRAWEYLRFVLTHTDSSIFPDVDEGNDWLTIRKPTETARLYAAESDIEDLKNELDGVYGDTTLTTPEWEGGYVNGQGNLYYNHKSARTIDIIDIPANSNVSVDSGASLSIHFYNESDVWQRYITVSGGNSYVFTQDARVRFGFSWANSASVNSVEVPNEYVHIHVYHRDVGYDANDDFWSGKKIVWFGTSIPAGVVNAGESGGNGAYPTRIGAMLGATVYNEAIGSSEVRGGTHGTYVTADDPNGYGGVSAPGLFLSMSLSSSEKQVIMDDWDSKWKNIITWYQSQVDIVGNHDLYINSSWDIMLAKYLSGGSVGQCDLYVFDHGYNDGARGQGFTELSDMPSNITDRRYWIGAMNFVISKILADNPKARIIIVGHYCTDAGSGDTLTKYVCEAQEKLAEYWNIPIIRTWEHMGFSHVTITVNGQTTTVAQEWMPDNLHPASDPTGEALKHYANVLYPLIRDVR